MWGFSTVDTAASVPVMVAVVHPSGPAQAIGLAPGDRLIGVGGRRVESTDQLLATLASASAGAPIGLEWVSSAGESRQGALQAVRGPLLLAGEPGTERASHRAAWAVVDIACSVPDASSARANLALLFSISGHHELALESWRKVVWGERTGIGEGTRQYYLGRALQALGREDEAVSAYRRAAGSAATAFHDEGPAVAPAALDRLADLGQAAECIPERRLRSTVSSRSASRSRMSSTRRASWRLYATNAAGSSRYSRSISRAVSLPSPCRSLPRPSNVRAAVSRR